MLPDVVAAQVLAAAVEAAEVVAEEQARFGHPSAGAG